MRSWVWVLVALLILASTASVWAAAPARGGAEPQRLVARRVVVAPALNGQTEGAWRNAPALALPLAWGIRGREPAGVVEMRALYDEQRLYLSASWDEPAPAVSEAIVNKLTMHWEFPAGALPCNVACHTAYIGPDRQVQALHAETIPGGGRQEALPAAGGWRDGRWTIEWSRPLRSANGYDVQMTDLDVGYAFFVKVFMQEPGRPDRVSPPAELVFE